MNRIDASTLLGEIGRRLGDRVILWRAFEPGSRDIDLLMLPGSERELAALLRDTGMHPIPGDPGHVWWESPDETVQEVDALYATAWPSYYPGLEGVRSRAAAQEAGPPLASAEDRLLMLGAEAVAGKPVEKITRKARALLAEPGVEERMRSLARAEGLETIADLAAAPDRLEAMAEGGRVPYGAAARIALRSGAARRALTARVGGRIHRTAPRPLRAPPAGRPLLVALSGMDGAGKSTSAEGLRTRMQDAGLAAEVAWARFGNEGEVLDRLAAPVKRILRREGTVADPVAAGGPGVEKVQDEREAGGRRRLVSWAWIVVVAATNARAHRRAAAKRRGGASVICDRWLTDSLVDLEMRYGSHRVAEAVLRALTPTPDLAVLLEIDAATSMQRKPGDQAERVLREMERLYARRAEENGLVRVNARMSPRAMRAELERLLDGVLPGG